MAVIETKFDVGDTVWFASTVTTQFQHACPDCLDSKEWEAKSPAGSTFKVACPRCSQTYQAHDELRLTYTKYTPNVRKLTIGSVRASTIVGDAWNEGNEYMALETGVGSGSVYREPNLFATEADALVAAQAKADAANVDPAFWVAKQYNKSVRFCDYELKDARINAAKTERSMLAYSTQYLISDLRDCSTIGEVTRELDVWAEREDVPPDPWPLA
jgi:hypothetical protein